MIDVRIDCSICNCWLCVFVWVCAISLFVQEAKRISGADALQRGSLYLQKLGKCKPPSLGAKLKQSVVEKTKAKGKKTRDIVKLADLEGVKKLLPQVKGCTLQLIPYRRCYTVFYVGALPGSHTCTWGRKFNQMQVLRACLTWAWSQHAIITGQGCPHDFDLCIV